MTKTKKMKQGTMPSAEERLGPGLGFQTSSGRRF